MHVSENSLWGEWTGSVEWGGCPVQTFALIWTIKEESLDYSKGMALEGNGWV